DVFAGTDRGYTNGLRFVWVSLDLNAEGDRVRLPGWWDGLSRKFPVVQPEGASRFVSLSVGQSIYTPADILRSDLIPDDRPYAGISYASLGFHAKDGGFMDTVELYAGLVGPSSLAGWVQRKIHHLFRWTFPEGWAHELHDEPVLGVVYDHKWKHDRTSESGGAGWDLIGHSGFELSNLWAGARSGFEIRGGWDIPGDFGTSLIQPGSDSASLFEERDLRLAGRRLVGVHFYLTVDGQWVARDLLLDGNTFRSSHRVEKNAFRAVAAAGFALRYKRLRFSFGYVAKTKEFETQRNNSIFGSLNLSFTLR
ncbi:MAG: lipid A deacylase LpxR family protein, partial [Candidatus Aminicenantes bacterium]|nr:lipid A deacylase LpxR family protein [Candidatus Aminicenantes bacterium]